MNMGASEHGVSEHSGIERRVPNHRRDRINGCRNIGVSIVVSQDKGIGI